jgi:hypothetical protein
VEAVPVAAPDDTVGHGEAADVIGHLELRQQRQRRLVAFLDPRGRLATVLGHGHPHGVAGDLQAARVVACAVVNLHARQALARGEVVARQRSAPRLAIHRAHPEDRPLDVDPLHVMRRALDERDANERQRGQSNDHRPTRRAATVWPDAPG